MQFDIWTFALQTINFVILVWLLKVFLYKPVMAAIERRKKQNEAAFEEAQAIKKQAEQDSQNFAVKTAELEAERDKIIADARVAESRAYDKLIGETKAETKRMRELAERDIAKEKDNAKIEIRRFASELAVDLARNILKESRTTSIHDIFLEKIVDHIKSMPQSEFKSLESQLDRGPVTVVSAEKFDAKLKKRWQSALNKVFERDVVLKFDADSALIEGVNLQFPDDLLGFNWKDILEQARETLLLQAGKND